MKGGYIIVSCLFTSLIYEVNSIEPVTTVIGVGTVTVALVSMAGMALKCRVLECCDTNWLHQQVPNLRASLNAHVYGQHLVVQTVPGAIKGHLTHPPKKALVMSFQGTTGTGKNLVARVVAENMYRKGLDSKYVYVISPTKPFSRPERIQDYKMVNWTVMSSDELVVRYLNTGGNMINEFSQEVYQSGKPRESMKLHNMEHALETLAKEETGGLEGSALITKKLINFFVPFLPLERSHVRDCIRDNLGGKIPTLASRDSKKHTELVNSAMKHITFLPDDQPLYSHVGCKNLDEIVNLVLEEELGD